MSQNEKIDNINHLYRIHGRKKLCEEDITDSLIEKLYDLMFLSIEFNEDEITDSTELYYFGKYYHISRNYEKMKRYYLRAIELNNDKAMWGLGYYYDTVGKDYDLMKKYYIAAIELNNNYCMYNLGCHYQTVEKNYDLMKKYYIAAIELNNNNAMNNLGVYYQNVEKNYDLMKKYFIMAAERGNQEAIKNLETYYLIYIDYSFLELYDCDYFKECCTDLINSRFKCDNIINLPNKYKQIFLKLDFTDNDSYNNKIDDVVKIKQNIFKLTLIFPSNYNSEYLEQFRVIESIVKSNRCNVLSKDLLFHITGCLFI